MAVAGNFYRMAFGVLNIHMNSKFGLMILSTLATMYQLGLIFQAGLSILVEQITAAVGICPCTSNLAYLAGRSAAKSPG